MQELTLNSRMQPARFASQVVSEEDFPFFGDLPSTTVRKVGLLACWFSAQSARVIYQRDHLRCQGHVQLLQMFFDRHSRVIARIEIASLGWDSFPYYFMLSFLGNQKLRRSCKRSSTLCFINKWAWSPSQRLIISIMRQHCKSIRSFECYESKSQRHHR